MVLEQLNAADPSDVRRWDALISDARTSDAYFRPGYVRAYEAAGHGKATCLFVTLSSGRALIPLLVRSVTTDDFGFQDAHTPYGYGGLLWLDEPQGLDEGTTAEIIRAIKCWGAEGALASVFLRLHPLMEQHTAFQSPAATQLGVTTVHGNATIAVDLAEWNSSADCISSVNKGRRSDLSVARRHLRVEGEGHLVAFTALYDEAMNRIGASSFYRFPASYYDLLTAELGSKLVVTTAWRGSDVVGGALFLVDGMFGHYHLSGANDVGRELKASTLIINTGAAIARRRGCRWLHLGGGVQEGDSLDKFKQSFGGKGCRAWSALIPVDGARVDALRALPNAPWPYGLAPRSS